MPPKKQLILLEPIYNLELTDNIGNELKIKDVLFVSSKKIPRIRKRLGFTKRFSEMERNNPWFKESILTSAKTFAVLRFSDNDTSKIEKHKQKITEAIWILASSQFSPGMRGNVRLFGLPEHGSHHSHEFMIHDPYEKDSRRNWKLASPVEPFRYG